MIFNTTANSMGWYGVWIFGQSNQVAYDPHAGDAANGYCNGQRTQAVIGSFTTCNNKRGLQIVSCSSICLENHIHMSHDFTGYEIFAANNRY